MGCGASSDAERPGRGRSRRNMSEDYSDDGGRGRRQSEEETDDSDSEGSSDTHSDFDEGGTGKFENHHLADRDAYKTQHMDKLWKIKVDILQSGEHHRMSIDDFSKQLSVSQKDVYRALDLFGQICDEKGRLRLELIARVVGWSPGKNLTMARIMDSFDEDRNGYVDFVEFLVLTKMFHGHFNSVDKARFWWWVALYTDQESVMGGEKTVKTMDRYKAENMMRNELRSVDRDGVARVPTQSLARFLRDALMSAGQLRDGHKNKFQGTEFISNPAPSKVLNKVNAAIRDAGVQTDQMVFHQFHDVVYQGHKHFGAVLDAMYNTLQRFLLSGQAPPFPGQLHLMRLRAFFYGKVEEYMDLEEQYDQMDDAEKLERSMASRSHWQHEFVDQGPSRASSSGAALRSARRNLNSSSDPDPPRRRLDKAHTHHGGAAPKKDKTPRQGPPPASESMQKHKSYRHLTSSAARDSGPRYYSPDGARAASADRTAPPKLKKGKTALQLQLADLDR